MSDTIIMIGEDGEADLYDDTYDITIHCETKEDYDKAMQMLESMRWIPCSERLPEEGQDILAYEVFGDDERIIPANYDNGCWFDCHMNCSVDHIVAWMPLPKPYVDDIPNEYFESGGI